MKIQAQQLVKGEGGRGEEKEVGSIFDKAQENAENRTHKQAEAVGRQRQQAGRDSRQRAGRQRQRQQAEAVVRQAGVAARPPKQRRSTTRALFLLTL